MQIQDDEFENQVTAEVISNVTQYPTPEGLSLSLVPVGLVPRINAWLVDAIIRMVIIMIFFVIMLFLIWLLRAAVWGFFAILIFMVNWLYPVYFEVFCNGMTPGKKMNGIYVCHDDGTPITFQASLIRNLLRVVDFLPFGFMAGMISIMFNGRSQRLGDMVAGTLVVYAKPDDTEKIWQSMFGKKQVKDEQSLLQLNANMTLVSDFNTYPLTLEEQQTLLMLLDRLPFLSQARQQEICQTLLPFFMMLDANHMSQHQLEQVRQTVLQRAIGIQGGGQ